MSQETKIIDELVENSIYRIDESTRMVTKSLTHISEAELRSKPNESSNSIANLILHLCGNITQYAISSLGSKEDIRDRDTEFSNQSNLTKLELLKKLTDTVETAKSVIRKVSTDEWLRKREVQGYNFSGIGIVIHVVEHYSYHTGQIAFWVKQLKNTDLGFYADVDLTVKNKN